MKKTFSFIKYIQLISLFAILAISILSCKKGSILEETNVVAIHINKLFSDSPPIDVYVNSKLVLELNTGEQVREVLIGESGTQVNVSFKKHGETAILIDTVFEKATAGMYLTYLYNEVLNWNQFVGPDFKRPSADSVAVQFFNNYSHGPSANIYIYKSPDGYNYNPADIVDSVKNLPLNGASKVVTLPYLHSSTGERILYIATVEDALTGYDGTKLYCIDLGLDPYNGWPLSDPLGGVDMQPGKLTIARADVFPYAENGVNYDMYGFTLLLSY